MPTTTQTTPLYWDEKEHKPHYSLNYLKTGNRPSLASEAAARFRSRPPVVDSILRSWITGSKTAQHHLVQRTLATQGLLTPLQEARHDLLTIVVNIASYDICFPWLAAIPRDRIISRLLPMDIQQLPIQDGWISILLINMMNPPKTI